jgi:hypothetical protein
VEAEKAVTEAKEALAAAEVVAKAECGSAVDVVATRWSSGNRRPGSGWPKPAPGW